MTTAPDDPHLRPEGPGDDTDIVALRTSLAADPADPRAASTLVERLLAAGRVAEASDVLEAELGELGKRDGAAPEPKRRVGRSTGQHAAQPDVAHRAERHRVAAQLGERLGRVDRALYHWQQAFRLEPARTDALEAARAIYASLGDDTMVARLYEAELDVLGDRGPAPRRAVVLLELGRLAFKKGDAIAAVASLEKALSLDKESIRAREALAEVYSSPAYATATADDAAEAARGAKRAGELFVELGRRRLKERDDTTGIGFLRRALGADPYSRTSSEALEKALAETGRFEELERVLRHREATAEDDRERLVLLGRRIALYEGPLQDRPALMEALGQLAAREPARGPAGMKLRAMLREDQRWDDLIVKLEADIELLADDALAQVTEVLELATVIREHVGDKDRAAELLHRALSIDPGNEEALARYAEHFRERRDWRGLADLYDFALDTARDQGAEVAEQVRRLEEIAQIAELRLHDAARAIDAWQRIDELEPGSPKAREALRRLGSRAKMWEQLVTVLEAEAQQARSSGERAEALRRIAQTYRERQVEPRRAIALFEEVVELSPDDDGALKALGELYEREGDDTGMARTMRRQLELEARRLGEADPQRGAREWPVNRRVERLTMLRRLAQMCEARLGDADGVVYACTGVLELLPGDRDALDRMERVLEKSGDQQRLEQTLEYHAASASGPAERARVLRRLARLAADAGDDARALDRWEQTLKAVPTDTEALEALAALYDGAKRWGELAGVLERLDASRPPVQPGTAAAALRVQELQRYARVVDEKLGDGQRGTKAWQRVLELSPRDRGALDALARLHRSAQRWRDLADVLAAQLPLHQVDDPPKAAAIALERAQLLEERLGAPVEAVKQLDRLIAELDPRNLDAHSALRRLHEARGDVEAAVRVAERELFLTDEPRQKIARGLEIGILCRDRLGDPVRALGAFQRVLALDPEDDEALSAAADLHARLSDWRSHVKVLEQRLALADGSRERRGLIFAIAQATAERLGDPRAGFKWLRRAHDEAPDAATLGELRRAAEAFGLWRELAEVYADERTRLLSQGGGVPADVAAYVAASRELAALAERRLGDKARALDALRDALEVVPREEGLLAECERIAAEADDRPLWRALLTSYEAVLKRSTPAARVTLHEKRARLLDERLGDAKAGVGELMAAFAWAPDRAEIRTSLEKLADKAKAWPEVVAIDTALIERAPTDAARVALLRRKAQVIEERLGDLPRAFRTHLLGFFLAPDDHETNQALWQLARTIGKYADADRSPRPEPPGATIHPERVHVAAIQEGQAAGPVKKGARARTDDLIAEVARGANVDDLDIGTGDLSVGDVTQPIDLDDMMLDRPPSQSDIPTAQEAAVEAPAVIESTGKKRADATMELSVDDLASLVVPSAPKASAAPRGLPGMAPPAAPVAPLPGTASGPVGSNKRPPPPPRRTAPPAPPPAAARPSSSPQAPGAAHRKAQAQVRRTPLPQLPQRAYASPWEELATACQMLPASDAAGRLRWLFRSAEIWETGAGDVSRAFDTLSRAMLLAAQTPGGDSEARARLHRLAGEHDAWDRLADLYTELADGASTIDAAIELLMEVAAIRAKQGRPREAEGQYRRVLGMRPADEVARARIEALYRGEERWVELAASLEERTDPRLGIAAPEAERPALLRELATIYVERLNRPHDAIDSLEKLRLLAPDDVDVLIGLGDLYTRVGRWSKVIEALSRVGDVADGTTAAREALRRIAEIYAQELELPERAMEAYAQLVSQWSDDESAYEALDALYQAHARWTDLVEVLRRRAALAKSPDKRAELLSRRAGILMEWLGSAEEAVAALRHARTILPDDPKLADQLIAALVAAKRGREAAAVLEGRIDRAKSAAPEQRGGAGELAALWIRLAQLRSDELDDVAGARKALDQALALVPDHPNALAALARLHRPEDDPAAFADAKLREADTATDDDARIDALMAAGEVLRDRLQDPARARGAFERVLALRPYHADATWALAGLVEQGGDADAAARLLETRLEDAALPADEKARVLTQLAALARIAGVEMVAERRLTEALAASARHVPAMIALADLLGDAGRWDELTVFLKETLDDPETAIAETSPPVAAELHRRLALAYEKEGREEDAYQTLLAADRLHRGHLLVKLALGENRYKARRWREAALHLGALAAHDDAPRHPAEVAQGLYHAALAEIRSLRPEKAPPLYARALELKPNYAPALQAMAEIAMEQGDHRRAADLLTRQATATEDHAERMRLFEALGDMSLMLLHDEARAKVCYDAAVSAAQPLEARHLPLLEKLLERQDLAGDHLGAARTAELMSAFGGSAAERAARLVRAAGDYVAGGDRERARAAAERAVEADPYDLDAVSMASEMLVADGNTEGAAAILGRALSSQTEITGTGGGDEFTRARRASLWLRLGQVRLSRGDTKQGEAALEKAAAVAPESDAAVDARRKLIELWRPAVSAPGGDAAKREAIIELLRAIAEATAERADIVAWADELRRADRPEARYALELAQGAGHTLDIHQAAYLSTHPATAPSMQPDAPYKGATMPDDAKLLVDEDERGLHAIAVALAEAAALLVPDPEDALARVGASGAKRVSPAAHLAAAEMAPRVAQALGTGATVMYARDDDDTPDVQVVCAGTPMIVLGPRLRGVRGDVPPLTELRFLLGRAAALAQPGRMIFAGAPRADAIRLLAAVTKSFGAPPLAAAVARHLDDPDEDVQRRHAEHVRTTLPVKMRQRLEQLLAGMTARELDLETFLQGCERTADRFGLLASDDPVAAFAAVRARGADPTHLVRAATSAGWLALRARLGWK